VKKPIIVCRKDLGTPTTLVVRAEQREVQRKVENMRTPPDTRSKVYRLRNTILDSARCDMAGENSVKMMEHNMKMGRELQAFKYSIWRVDSLVTSESFCTKVK